MQRLMHAMHETRETFVALLAVACLMAGIGAATFYTVGPDGWLAGMVQRLLLDPSLGAIAAPFAVIVLAVGGKRLLDSRPRSVLNNLLVGVIGLAGFAVILQGIRSLLA